MAHISLHATTVVVSVFLTDVTISINVETSAMKFHAVRLSILITVCNDFTRNLQLIAVLELY